MIFKYVKKQCPLFGGFTVFLLIKFEGARKHDEEMVTVFKSFIYGFSVIAWMFE